jgi:hypothetical protein
MPWPQSTDYNLAIQNPHLCFQDADLRACTAFSADPVLGLPTPRAGNFADVYQLVHPNGQSWAVKCFTREVEDLHDRYAAISEHLRRNQRSFIIEFRYLDEGILVDGTWYPVLKMRWVEGKTLNEFIREHADKPGILDRLGQMWLKLALDLREIGVGHGDLQHGNVLLIPNPRKGSFHLRLIDYDGMYVPALVNRPSKEAGFPGFQHPRRTLALYGPEVDRFSHLVIYTALRSLRAGGARLWSTFGTVENLLFSETDFTAPAKSELLRTLFALADTQLRHLVGHLVLAAVGDVAKVPLLSEILPDGIVRRLEVAEYERLREVVGPMLLGVRRSKLDARTPAPKLDTLPPLPAPLRDNTRMDPVVIGTPVAVPVPVPQARRVEETGGLPDWMLPEAEPLDDSFVRALPLDDDEDVPTFALPPMILVPLEPVDRPPPPVPGLMPVLLEETTTRPQPTPEKLPVPVPIPQKPDEETYDVLDPVPEPRPAPRRTKVEKSRPRIETVKESPEAEEPEEKKGTPVLALMLAGGLIVLFTVLGGMLAYWVHRQNMPPAPPPPPQAATLQVPEVTLEGGQQKTVTVGIQRNSSIGPFTLRVTGLAAPVVIKSVAVPDLNAAVGGVLKATCTLSAPLDVPPSTIQNGTVELLQGETVLDTQSLRVVLTRPVLPVLGALRQKYRVETGQHERLSFPVDRRGRSERFRIEFADLPRGIQQDCSDAGPRDTQGIVQINVPAKQAVGPVVAWLRLLIIPESADETRFEAQRIAVVLDVARPKPTQRFLTVPPETISVESGKTASLRVEVDHKVVPGTLRLELRNLPMGVTAPEIEVTAAEQHGVFLLSAAAFAVLNKITPIEVVAWDGTDELGKVTASVRVTPATVVMPPPALPR